MPDTPPRFRLRATTTAQALGFDRWELAAWPHAERRAEIDGSTLRLLSCFVETTSSEEAARRCELPPEVAATAVADLVEMNVLIDPEAARGQAPGASYFEEYGPEPYSPEAITGIVPALLEAVQAAGVAPSLEGLRVLDVGCATGALVLALRGAGALAFGIEVSTFALSHAVRAATPFLFHMNAHDLSVFPEDAFDLLVVNLMPHLGAANVEPWLARTAPLARRGVFLRYVRPDWVAGFVADRGEEVAARMDLDWARPTAWWHEAFAGAGLRVLHERRDEDWDTWVLLGH